MCGWVVLGPYHIKVGKTYEPVRKKTKNLGSDQVRHEPGCTVTKDGQRLEILDLESRGIVLSVLQKQRR